jgi:periplasmic protein TonB
MIRTILMLGIVAMSLSSFSQEVPQTCTTKDTTENPVFSIVESEPSFPGGDKARIKFLQENVVYPRVARESGIQGTVYATFVVERDGNITDIRILRGIGGGCDDEVVRVLRLMPEWIPGKCGDDCVRVQFNMPMKFTLAGGSDEKNTLKKKKKFLLF